MHLKSINNIRSYNESEPEFRLAIWQCWTEYIQMVSISLPVRKLTHGSPVLPCVPGRSWQVCPDPAYTHGCTCLCCRRRMCCCSASPRPEPVLLRGRGRELRAAAAVRYGGRAWEGKMLWRYISYCHIGSFIHLWQCSKCDSLVCRCHAPKKQISKCRAVR